MVMAIPQGNIREFDARPSPLGVFLTRIGIKRDYRKSPTASVSPQQFSGRTPPETTFTSPVQNHKEPSGTGSPAVSPLVYQRLNTAKAKLRTSSFLRVVHRLTMNRKPSRKDSEEAAPSGLDFGGSFEEFDTSLSSSICSESPETSPRPAWSESDLRHITVRAKKVPTESITPLAGVNTFCSEDNLLCSAPNSAPLTQRTPSYLRVSCALNGYRQYRRLNETPVSHKTSVFPLGIVERRTLALENATTPAGGSNLSNKEGAMMGPVLNTPTPVRQLVARFNDLRISNGGKSCEEGSSPEKRSLDDQGSPAGVSHLIEECCALPISRTLHSSIPLSGQTLDKALSQPTPEPELAHAIHSGLRESTVSHCQPNAKNQSEVIVSELQTIDADVARKVSSEVSANLLSGEHFRKLLIISRDSLQKRSSEASKVLGSGDDIPEAATDSLRLAIGKANLLLSKKLKTFGELIEKNLHPIEGDTQPAKLDDLSAYWDLVKMELDDVEGLFSDVNTLRQNGWQSVSSTDNISARSSQFLAPSTKQAHAPIRKPRVALVPHTKDASKSAAAEKQRRDALAEAKRKLRERVKKEESGSSSFIV